MNNIYRIENDSFGFKWLALETLDIIDLFPEEFSLKQIHKFSYHNISLQPWWRGVSSTFKANFDRTEDPIPDISVWLGNACLVLSEKSYSSLHKALVNSGEFLTVECDGLNFYIFNCLDMVENFDFSGTAANQKLIFKTALDNCTELYCTDQFKKLLENMGLKGIHISSEIEPSFE